MGQRDYTVGHLLVHVIWDSPNGVQGPQIGLRGYHSQYLHRSSWDQHWETEKLFASSKALLVSY